MKELVKPFTIIILRNRMKSKRRQKSLVCSGKDCKKCSFMKNKSSQSVQQILEEYLERKEENNEQRTK